MALQSSAFLGAYCVKHSLTYGTGKNRPVESRNSLVVPSSLNSRHQARQ